MLNFTNIFISNTRLPKLLGCPSYASKKCLSSFQFEENPFFQPRYLCRSYFIAKNVNNFYQETTFENSKLTICLFYLTAQFIGKLLIFIESIIFAQSKRCISKYKSLIFTTWIDKECYMLNVNESIQFIFIICCDSRRKTWKHSSAANYLYFTRIVEILSFKFK